MPKSTFFRISEEKQNRIVEAARNEFLSTPYSEVSINRIIKEAEIPRGSFYQYFEDKEDLFDFVLEEHKNNLLTVLVKEIERAKGDIFCSIEEQIDRVVDFAYSDDSEKFRSLFSEPKILEMLWMEIIKNESCKDDVSIGLVDRIDRSKLDVENEEELGYLLSIIATLIRDSIGELFIKGSNVGKDEMKRVFHARIGTLKRHYIK